MSKEKSQSKRAEGSRKERAGWIKNKVEAQIAAEERELLFRNGVTGVEYQIKIKRILTQIYVCLCGEDKEADVF